MGNSLSKAFLLRERSNPSMDKREERIADDATDIQMALAIVFSIITRRGGGGPAQGPNHLAQIPLNRSGEILKKE
jgi:hypothetical protein